MDITTKASPCIRYVLIRNVDCKKYTRDPATYVLRKPDVSSILTSRGDEMAKALACLIDYMESRKYCVKTDPKRKYTIVVDNKTTEHAESAKYLIEKHPDVPVIYTDDVTAVDRVDKDCINTFIVFTGTSTIRKMFNLGENYLVGPALGATTTYDVPFEGSANRIFVHHFSSLAAIQHGGYDTTANYWWNNSP